MSGHSVCQRCCQVLSECLMNFPGHKSHHNSWNKEDNIRYHGKVLIEVVGSQERILPAAEVVGQGSSEDICSRSLAGTANQFSVFCWGRSLEK